jgi:hypothetical protein
MKFDEHLDDDFNNVLNDIVDIEVERKKGEDE